ncbi:amidohydrolase [bacterium]|nr:amidohydrolase [bacterium]
MSETTRTLYINGDIVSMDFSNRRCSALAVSGDRITALGSNEEIKSLSQPGSKIVDLGGKTVLPGFIDPHSHFFIAGYFSRFFVDLNSPPIGEVTCMADLLTRLKTVADDTPPGEWISGYGYDDTMITEKRHPTRHDLDRVSTGHPIAIRHISGHLLAANSQALALRNVTRETPDPEGGHIQKDSATGEPLGILEETAMNLVQDFLPGLTPEKAIEAVGHGSERYLRTGVTTAQDGFAFPPFLDFFRDALKTGALKNRVHVLPSGNEDLGQYRSSRAGTDLSGNHMVSLGALKMIQDGSIQGFTACLSQPYYTLPEDRPDLAFNYHGYRTHEPRVLQQKVLDAHLKGWQIAIHANGDLAVEDCLNAFEAAQKTYPRNDARHIIIHCQTVREDQLDRIKRLGVIPAFFAVHTYYWGDRHESLFLGPGRSNHMNPCRSALDRGIPFTNHNDDFVTPINPLLSIWSAVNRLSIGGRLIGATQRIPVLEAIRSVTTYAAFQNHEEKLKGSLEPGKLADMVVLAENPLDIDPLRIKDIEVLATIVGGEVAYGRV